MQEGKRLVPEVADAVRAPQRRRMQEHPRAPPPRWLHGGHHLIVPLRQLLPDAHGCDLSGIRSDRGRVQSNGRHGVRCAAGRGPHGEHTHRRRRRLRREEEAAVGRGRRGGQREREDSRENHLRPTDGTGARGRGGAGMGRGRDAEGDMGGGE